VSVSQLTGEHNRSYLRRVEELSRQLPYFKAKAEYTEQTVTALDTTREEMCMVIATNGLKDLCLRKDLLSKRDLGWKSLEATVLSRGVAEESSELLEQLLSATINEEIAEVKRMDYKSRKCFSCNQPDPVASQCPAIQCYKCRGRGHLARDCGEHSLPRGYEGYPRGRDSSLSRRRPGSLPRNRSRDRSLSRGRYYRPRESSRGREGSLNRDYRVREYSREPRSSGISPGREGAIVPYRREGNMPYRREGGSLMEEIARRVYEALKREAGRVRKG